MIDASLWAILTVCHGLAGGEPCVLHHAGPLNAYTCPRTVTALKLAVGTTKAWCASTPPAGSTPLPRATSGAIHAGADAQPYGLCNKTEDVEASLSGAKWRESHEWTGLSTRGTLMQLWISTADTWTLVERYPGGESCFRAAGTGSSGPLILGRKASMEPM